MIALLSTVGTLAMSIWLMASFETGESGFQFVSKHTWIEPWGISWHLGVDGISLFLVVLTGVLFPLAIAGMVLIAVAGMMIALVTGRLASVKASSTDVKGRAVMEKDAVAVTVPNVTPSITAANSAIRATVGETGIYLAGGAIAVIIVLSALVSIRKVMKLEPAIVFKM